MFVNRFNISLVNCLLKKLYKHRLSNHLYSFVLMFNNPRILIKRILSL